MAMGPNLRSLYMSGMYPLGVECRGCGHKALVPAERFGGCKGDMTELRSLRLVCQSCGSRERETTVFLRAGEAEAWLEGLSLSPMGGGGPSF
jgi:DNA-directed RNA polymerase subunit RPC12/RpoP